MKTKIKTYKTFDYYITQLVGIIAVLTLLFFIAAGSGDEWTVNLYSGEITKGYYFFPAIVAIYCFKTTSSDRKNWKKKNK